MKAGLGQLVQFGVDAANQGLQYGANKRTANDAYDRQKNWATRGPGYVRQGLEAAGFNPILATGNLSGIMGGKAPQGGSSGLQKSDITKQQKVKPEKALLAAQEENTKQQTATSAAIAAREAESAKYHSAMATKAQTEKRLLDLKIPLAAAEAEYIASDLGKKSVQTAVGNRYLKDASPSADTFIGGAATGAVHYVPKVIDAVKKEVKKAKKGSNETFGDTLKRKLLGVPHPKNRKTKSKKK
ncbi:hypothetical protein [Microviridae sp.]|nr:hypothetical protein [Microviridae sp.]